MVNWLFMDTLNKHFSCVSHTEIGDCSIEYSPRLDLGARAAWTVFIRSFNAATYDIKEDKRGMLFQRLIEPSPPNPDDPEMQFPRFVWSHKNRRSVTHLDCLRAGKTTQKGLIGKFLSVGIIWTRRTLDMDHQHGLSIHLQITQ